MCNTCPIRLRIIPQENRGVLVRDERLLSQQAEDCGRVLFSEPYLRALQHILRSSCLGKSIGTYGVDLRYGKMNTNRGELAQSALLPHIQSFAATQPVRRALAAKEQAVNQRFPV